MLQDGNYNPTDYRGVYDLVMTAYDDKRLAGEARTRAMEALIDDRCQTQKR